MNQNTETFSPSSLLIRSFAITSGERPFVYQGAGVVVAGSSGTGAGVLVGGSGAGVSVAGISVGGIGVLVGCRVAVGIGVSVGTGVAVGTVGLIGAAVLSGRSTSDGIISVCPT